MKVKVLKGFRTSALGTRKVDEVFEVPDGVKVQALINQGYLSGSRAEPTVDLAADAGAVTIAAPVTGKGSKAGGKGKR